MFRFTWVPALLMLMWLLPLVQTAAPSQKPSEGDKKRLEEGPVYYSKVHPTTPTPPGMIYLKDPADNYVLMSLARFNALKADARKLYTIVKDSDIKQAAEARKKGAKPPADKDAKTRGDAKTADPGQPEKPPGEPEKKDPPESKLPGDLSKLAKDAKAPVLPPETRVFRIGKSEVFHTLECSAAKRAGVDRRQMMTLREAEEAGLRECTNCRNQRIKDAK